MAIFINVIKDCVNTAYMYSSNKTFFFRSINIEPEMPDEASEDQPVVYKVVEKGSKRDGKLLVSSDGHSYNLRVKFLLSYYIWTNNYLMSRCIEK